MSFGRTLQASNYFFFFTNYLITTTTYYFFILFLLTAKHTSISTSSPDLDRLSQGQLGARGGGGARGGQQPRRAGRARGAGRAAAGELEPVVVGAGAAAERFCLYRWKKKDVCCMEDSSRCIATVEKFEVLRDSQVNLRRWLFY